MVLKSAIIAAAVAAFAFTASTDAFAAKKGKKGYKNSVQHEKTHRVAHKGLPMRVILRDLRHRGYRKLRVRDGRLPGLQNQGLQKWQKVFAGRQPVGWDQMARASGTLLALQKLQELWQPNYSEIFTLEQCHSLETGRLSGRPFLLLT